MKEERYQTWGVEDIARPKEVPSREKMGLKSHVTLWDSQEVDGVHLDLVWT